ncbi:MAG TPA: helix-turn-helix transcriptional regulator [Terriglobia bacterium]|nr:helix-turn-helix transcriptional regulator [Terriglobia bacterium]
MRMAERIQQIRLARWVTLDDVEAKTGLAKSQMARLETGQEVPTLEILDTLADAIDVPILVFFYDTVEPEPAPSPEIGLALKELAQEFDGLATSALVSNSDRSVLAVIKEWLGAAARALTRDRRLSDCDPIL